MNKTFKDILSYVAIIIGALLAAFSVACILLPNDAIDYGTAGVAIIISKMTGFSLSPCVLFVFLPFLILSVFVLGVKFSIKAMVGAVVYTVGLDIFEEIPFQLNTEHFLAVAFGGAVLGLGLSLILRYGGCIDGSEIFANIVIKKLSDKTGKNFSMSGILIAFNACVYTAAFFLINRNAALLSLLVYFVATTVPRAFFAVTVASETGEPLASSTRPLMTDEPRVPCAGVKMAAVMRLIEVKDATAEGGVYHLSLPPALSPQPKLKWT